MSNNTIRLHSLIISVAACFQLSISYADAIDFSRCEQLLKSESSETISFQNGKPAPVAIRPDLISKIETTAQGPSVSTSISSNLRNRETVDFKLAQISPDSYSLTSQQTRYGETDKKEFTFQIKNNICFPATGAWNGKNIFNTELCHEINSFFLKNPDILKCQCGEESLYNKLNGLVSKMGPPTKTGFKFDASLIDQSDVDTLNYHRDSSSPAESGRIAFGIDRYRSSFDKSQIPVLMAHRLIDECKEYPGVAESAEDKLVWKDAPNSQPVGETKSEKAIH